MTTLVAFLILKIVHYKLVPMYVSISKALNKHSDASNPFWVLAILVFLVFNLIGLMGINKLLLWTLTYGYVGIAYMMVVLLSIGLVAWKFQEEWNYRKFEEELSKQ